jgi:uncharacterized protein (TIGR02145 family)
MTYNNAEFGMDGFLHSAGYSVRCIYGDYSIPPNQPPDTPLYISPENGAQNQAVETTLSWSCSDPEGDPLTYDVYFGPQDLYTLVAPGISEPFYSLPTLDYNNTYSWQIVARDNHNYTNPGPVWEFSTTDEIPEFECGNLLTDPRNWQSYQTVQIGDQCWMAENLNIGFVTNEGEDMSNNGVIEKYCYNNSPLKCNIYGGLYQWDEMMQYTLTGGAQGICPEEWHIPTDAEWSVLVDYLGGTNEAGGKMKEAGNEHWYAPNTGATNSSGFTGLPASYRSLTGTIDWQGYNGSFWSSEENEPGMPWFRELKYNDDMANRWFASADHGFSVRCISNNSGTSNQPPNSPSGPVPSDGAEGQPLNLTLSWSCSDPDNDPLTYDVSFGFETEMTVIATGISENSYTLPQLEFNSGYYWMITAYDDHGNITEGPVWNFTTIEENANFQCGNIFFDERDGQSYQTVQIGNQCWMTENIRFGEMLNSGEDMTDNGIPEKYCYNDTLENCNEYGGFYKWDEMMGYETQEGVQGICCNGWHLPADDEWTVLINYLGGDEVAGGSMKEAGTSHWNLPNTGATNSSGFTALPSGELGYGNFYGLGVSTVFWSSSETFGSNAWMHGLSFQNVSVTRGFAQKQGYGFSVRCVMDDPGLKK